jgi:hypothetical protein
MLETPPVRSARQLAAFRRLAFRRLARRPGNSLRQRGNCKSRRNRVLQAA